MADEVKNGLSSDPSRIASQWNRSTVADGSWLQKYTLSPLTARDYYLASAIDELDSATDDSLSALSAAISSVSAIHDEYINYLSATISGDISGYIDYVSGQVDVLSGDLKTSAETLLRLIDEEHGRADDAETKINNRLDNMEAATDVIDVYGSWDDFTTNSGDLFTLSGITDNDIIKILNDKNSYPNEMFPTAQSAASGHQTYFRWINSAIPASAHIKPLDPTSGYWDFIGYVDPYYTTTEIDEYLNELSGTIADNYLSANNTAVSGGKNIIVTNETGPKVGIKTKDDVEFTNVSSTNISATNVTALTATGNSANFTNITATNILADSIRSELGTVFGWNLGFNDANGVNLTANTITTINLNAATLNDTNIDSLIGSAQSGKYAWNIFSGTKITGYNGTTPNTAYLSGGFAIKAGDNLTLTYADKTFTLNAGDTGVTSISSVSPAVKFTSANIAFSAGNETTFTTANNILGINASNTLINSAKSGQSAYNWITTKSATLSAGPGIGFVSAGPNILGISAEGTTYSNGRCIEIDNNKINLSSTISADNIIMSGVDGGTNVSAYYSPSGIHLKRAGQPGPEVYLTPFDISSVVPNGHMSSITSTTSWDALMNSHYVSAATQPLTFSSAPPNIVPSEMIDNVIYLI